MCSHHSNLSGFVLGKTLDPMNYLFINLWKIFIINLGLQKYVGLFLVAVFFLWIHVNDYIIWYNKNTRYNTNVLSETFLAFMVVWNKSAHNVCLKNNKSRHLATVGKLAKKCSFRRLSTVLKQNVWGVDADKDLECKP